MRLMSILPWELYSQGAQPGTVAAVCQGTVAVHGDMSLKISMDDTGKSSEHEPMPSSYKTKSANKQ